MYEVKTGDYTPVNFFAGAFPVVTETGAVKENAKIRKYAPVALTAEGIVEVEAPSGEGDSATPGNIDALCGIAADDSGEGGVVYYMTGEFFAAALTLPDGVTLDALKPACRKLSIFLK